MKLSLLRTVPHPWSGIRCLACVLLALWAISSGASVPTHGAEPGTRLEAGIAVQDVSPDGPIWLAGYAARNRPSDKIDTPLMVQAVALRSPPGDPVVLVALDNCEVSRHFTKPVLDELAHSHGLGPGRVMIVSSHTHSAPVLDGPLMGMYRFSAGEQEQVARYGRFLQEKLVQAVGAALKDLQPSQLEYGVGKARFAMNRRVYRGDEVVFGENPDGPVDWDVPVLKITGATNNIRGILFGYACHGTSIAGDDFYTVSGDYMAYARQHLEGHYPNATAAFFTGMGADSNPSPRGRLIDAKRHGLELAGAVVSVLERPMREISGALRFAYDELELPLPPPPSREQLERDARSENFHVQHRAQAYLARIARGEKPEEAVTLPMAVLRIGTDLTVLAMGGEVVVDYALRFKRLIGEEKPWLIGYAYEVPCYIPSIRILKEGGYEADSSLIYYGLYGPLKTSIEEIILRKGKDLLSRVR